MLSKDNLLVAVVVVLLSIIFIEKCNQPAPVEPPKVVRDTIWVVKDSLITGKPQVTKTIQILSSDTIINHYIPDTNYKKLIVQYQEVVNQLLAKNIHQDSVRIDTNGYVKIVDTVQKNLIVGRSTRLSIKYPVIKETITVPEKKVNQLYVGGVFQTGRQNQQIGGSALLKTRKDFIVGASLSVNTYGDPMYGLGAFWKIKLK